MSTAYAAARLRSEINNTVQVTEIDLSRLTRGTMFISTHFTLGIGRMKKLTGLQVTTDADQSLLRHQKKLLESKELDAIRNADGAIRRYLELKTCTYVEGMSFLPTELLDEVDEVLTRYQEIERPALVKTFMAVYASQKVTALLALGSEGSEKDYPSADIVEDGFEFTYQYLEVKMAGDLQTLNPLIARRQSQQAEKLMLKAAEEVRIAMRETVAGLVDKLADVLKPNPDGTRKKLFDSHLEKLDEYLRTFNCRNITDDQKLQDHVEALRRITSGVTTDKLRESISLKVQLASRLDVVNRSLAQLVTEMPVRRIR